MKKYIYCIHGALTGLAMSRIHIVTGSTEAVVLTGLLGLFSFIFMTLLHEDKVQ